MSHSARKPPASHDEAVEVIARLGALVVAVVAISVAVNVFAGGVVFSAGLAALAVYAGIHPTHARHAASAGATRRLAVERRPRKDER
jgi:hypothetical protein